MNTFNFLSLLPGALGLCGFVVYLLWAAKRPPSPILLEVLSIIKEKKGRFPQPDGRLTGAQVYKILQQHPEFREVLSDREYRLIEGVRKDEFKERFIALAAVVLLVIASLSAFAYTQTPNPKTPIHEISLSGEAWKTATFATEKYYLEKLFPYLKSFMDSEFGYTEALNHGVSPKRVRENTELRAFQSMAFYVSPNSSLAPSALQLEGDAEDPSILDWLTISIKVFKEPPEETIIGIAGGQADLELHLTLLHQPYVEHFIIGLDPTMKRIMQKFVRMRPNRIVANATVQDWEDLLGMYMYAQVTIPLSVEGLWLSIGSDQRAHYIVKDSDFERLDMVNEVGFPVTIFKTKLSTSMTKRASDFRVVDRLRW